MTRVASSSVVRQLESLFENGSVAGLSDRHLLEQFSEGGPTREAAFAALVGRHGPMVLGVCRQIVGDAQHAEDAFQAVFLVLAQKAASIRDPDLLGNWLYGVAVRTARCAKQKIARRRKWEEHATMNAPGAGLDADAAAESRAPSADLAAIDREQAEAIHGEVDRLPRAFRLPVVLCYFEGLTLDEAAKRLRCPAGTLRSRLARARQKLGVRLSRRGVALPAAAFGAILAPRSASASISPLLCETTTRAATAFAANSAANGALSVAAGSLAQEVLNTMLINKFKLFTAIVFGLAALATGAGFVTRTLAMRHDAPKNPTGTAAALNAGRGYSDSTVGRGSPDTQRVANLTADRRSPKPLPPQSDPRPTDPSRPSSARMTVAGRVLGPDGKPVAGAVVDLIARRRSPRVGTSDQGDDYALLGQARSDGEGRFRLDAARTGSTRVFEVHALAAAPGYGLGWAELNPDAEQPAAEIKLQPEQVVRVRLVDVTGAPAKGVEVRVSGVGQPKSENEARYDGVSVGVNPPEGLRIWPKPVKSDDQGRIAVSGSGRGSGVGLQVRDLRYARQGRFIDVATAAAGEETTVALEPARIIEGRVLAADTGSPIPNAIVSATTLVKNERARGFSITRFRADAQGRFIMNLAASDNYTLEAFPSGGEPYLPGQAEVKWTKGAVKASQDITVRRGVAIRGKVTEQGTGRRLGGASIQYIPVRGRGVVTWGSGSIVASRDDGSFAVAVPPGKGHLIVFGPTGDYVLGEIGFNWLRQDRPGGARYRAPAIIAYEVKAGDSPHEVAAVLRPGVTIKGRVEGPDNQTVTDAFVLTAQHVEPTHPSWNGQNRIPVRDGHFELHGLDPDGSARISILDSEHEWGATLDVSGKRAGEDLTIRLQPCGQAKARFVGPDGKPIVGHRPLIEFVATPGPSSYSRNEPDQAELLADAEMLVNLDRKHYGTGRGTDAEGRITLPDLIPGAQYRITDGSTINEGSKGPRIRKDFTVKPGETLDLGDILIAKPEPQ